MFYREALVSESLGLREVFVSECLHLRSSLRFREFEFQTVWIREKSEIIFGFRVLDREKFGF